MAGQSDVMQAQWGSHGDYEIVAYAPASPQELFDLTVLSFNVADRYRTPVILLGDEVIGHMMERVIIPPADEIQLWQRKRPSEPPNGNGQFMAFSAQEDDLVPPIAHAGEGYRVHFTGLTHDQRGYPDMDADTHHKLITRLVEKIRRSSDQIIRLEEYHLRDAEVVVLSYGCTARSARHAVREARRIGIPAGLLRLISIWPFPENQIRELTDRVQAFVVAEMNLGQISRELERHVSQPVIGVHHAGGAMIPPEPILDRIKKAVSTA
jgi:2-oxoglutarate ferredoxin oxidoreductase subunit alpha